MLFRSNCDIFNDGAFAALKDADTRDDVTIRLAHGEPIVFGAAGDRCVVRGADGTLKVALVADVAPSDIVVHDAHAADPSLAFSLSRLSDPETLANTPMGVFRDVSRPVYDTLLREQVEHAIKAQGPGSLDDLLRGKDHWQVG